MDKKPHSSVPPPPRGLGEEELISSLAHTGRIVANKEAHVNPLQGPLQGLRRYRGGSPDSHHCQNTNETSNSANLALRMTGL